MITTRQRGPGLLAALLLSPATTCVHSEFIQKRGAVTSTRVSPAVWHEAPERLAQRR